ncbi:MAG: hypothetical protein H3C33_07125 [Rhodocyclaceae bacterium]|nr:hypothetical protein [Rhodocyclaceae bacterium]
MRIGIRQRDGLLTRRDGLLAALVVAGFVLRLQGLDWDQGRGLHPDEGNLVRAAIALGPGQMIPEFHAYNDLALWLPRLAALPFCDSTSPDCLRGAARVLSAVFSGLAVWAMAAVAARLAGGTAGRTAALATALLAATSAPLIQWAHFGTTESALVLLVALLWLQSLRWLRGEIGPVFAAATSALLVGVGFGFKTTALVCALIPLLALVQSRGEAARAGWRALRWALPLGGLAALAAAPSVIFAPGNWLDSMRFERGVVAGSIPVFWTRQFAHGSGAMFQLHQLWSLLHGAGLVLAVVGVAFAPRTARPGLVAGLGYVLVHGAVVASWHAGFVRYLAPLLPVLVVAAGMGVARLAASGLRVLRALAVAGAGLWVLAGLDLAASYQAPDPRILAETALATSAAAGAVVGIEPHDTPLPGNLSALLLPLEDTDAAPLAEALARSDWLLIASRRNWAVLPGHPDAPLACGYYAALASGALGFRIEGRFHRASPLWPLLAPGLSVEETRTVFDRPQVVIFRNDARLDAGALEAVLTTAPGPCDARTLGRAWGRAQ